MAVLGATLLSLCLGTLFISASSADFPDRCMFFSTVSPTTGPGIKISSNIYESNRVYTVLVPVNNITNSVALRAVDTSNNSTVGLWHRADLYCDGSVLYHVTDTRENFLKANWQSPRYTNITVEIHNDHSITLHDLHDLNDLHDQADHNPKPNNKPNPNHSPDRNFNSNHSQKLRQQNLPQPHHRCHPDPARLPHQQTPLLERC
ncbi:placenta-expressed transcript 1 protein isoform X4 [Pipistrellus kuhlii]|uniref:placenta-expressed transcript 1 protein isoform X4 n=1 Tax=Pipistrellus kuhlii TaxID=59472 RepID=UPI00174EF4F0|nr:placenta-expressed transcript 1 protein isoform X4 [Pipistrellus kuhlii]